MRAALATRSAPAALAALLGAGCVMGPPPRSIAVFPLEMLSTPRERRTLVTCETPEVIEALEGTRAVLPVPPSATAHYALSLEEERVVADVSAEWWLIVVANLVPLGPARLFSSYEGFVYQRFRLSPLAGPGPAREYEVGGEFEMLYPAWKVESPRRPPLSYLIRHARREAALELAQRVLRDLRAPGAERVRIVTEEEDEYESVREAARAGRR